MELARIRELNNPSPWDSTSEATPQSAEFGKIKPMDTALEHREEREGVVTQATVPLGEIQLTNDFTPPNDTLRLEIGKG